LQLIEAYGTGIQKIFEAYKSSLSQPKIEVTPNVFKMILPNLNKTRSVNANEAPEKRLMQYVRENGSVNRKQAEQLLGISQTAAGNILRQLAEQNELAREGNARNTRYFIPKP
jgi:ATP-dependent DNA helicase RecG